MTHNRTGHPEVPIVGAGPVRLTVTATVKLVRRVMADVDAATRFVSSDERLATFLHHRVLLHLAARDFAQRRTLKQIAGLVSPAAPWLEGVPA